MTVKKSLGNRIRGWFPQEPVLKAPLNVKIVPINSSTSFKVRRWLHGTSAFMASLLWRQRSKRSKIDAMLFGFFVIFDFFLYFLVASKVVNFFWFNFGLLILMVSYFSLQWLISFYFKGKEPYKNKLNTSPNLRLGGIISSGIAGAILVYSYYLAFFVYSVPQNASTVPPLLGFYLDLLALFMISLGFGLYMLWRKRNKIEPFSY